MGMNLRDQYPGYLRKEDLPKPTLLTIKDILEEQMPDGVPKPVCYFDEMPRGWVVNKTNANILCDLFGPETDDMIGRKIVLYADPNILFGGKRVGGIMCRAPKANTSTNHTAPPTKIPTRKPSDPDAEEKAAFNEAMAAAAESEDDDIPF